MVFENRISTNKNRKIIKIISQTADEIVADIIRDDNGYGGTQISAKTFNDFQDKIDAAYDLVDNAIFVSEIAKNMANQTFDELSRRIIAPVKSIGNISETVAVGGKFIIPCYSVTENTFVAEEITLPNADDISVAINKRYMHKIQMFCNDTRYNIFQAYFTIMHESAEPLSIDQIWNFLDTKYGYVDSEDGFSKCEATGYAVYGGSFFPISGIGVNNFKYGFIVNVITTAGGLVRGYNTFLANNSYLIDRVL